MRILLDECVDERLRNFLPGHDCWTARYAGLAGLKNSELLNTAESAGFHVLLTVDQGLEYEQNLQGRSISVVIFHAKSNRREDLVELIDECLAVLAVIKPGEMVRIPRES
jgi:predicted nuclease of predicted toxin-antitoxin system